MIILTGRVVVRGVRLCTSQRRKSPGWAHRKVNYANMRNCHNPMAVFPPLYEWGICPSQWLAVCIMGRYPCILKDCINRAGWCTWGYAHVHRKVGSHRLGHIEKWMMCTSARVITRGKRSPPYMNGGIWPPRWLAVCIMGRYPCIL